MRQPLRHQWKQFPPQLNNKGVQDYKRFKTTPIECFQSCRRLIQIRRTNASPIGQKNKTRGRPFIDNYVMDIFPMDKSMDLESQVVGKRGFIMFQVDKNQIRCWRIWAQQELGLKFDLWIMLLGGCKTKSETGHSMWRGPLDRGTTKLEGCQGTPLLTMFLGIVS